MHLQQTNALLNETFDNQVIASSATDIRETESNFTVILRALDIWGHSRQQKEAVTQSQWHERISTQHRQSIGWQSETHAETKLISHFLLARLNLQCKINLTLIWVRRGRVERWGAGARWRAANHARVQIRCVAQLYFLVSPVLERKPLCSATLF